MPDDTANTTNGVSRQELNVESVENNNKLLMYQKNNPDSFKFNFATFLPELERDIDKVGSEGSTGDTDAATAGTTASGLKPVIEDYKDMRFAEVVPFMDYTLQLANATPEMKKARGNGNKTQAQEDRQQ